MARNHSKPLIIHVLDRLSLGGMETVAVNLIEHSHDRYSHRVICLRSWTQGPLMVRLERLQVPVLSVGKQPGKDLLAYVRLRRMLRDHHPDIVHTYNIGTIDVAICARLAGVRHVVHAEHGRDATDPHGHNAKYRWLRRVLAPAISAFVPVSKDLSQWLAKDVGIREDKIRLIYNGIDMDCYGQHNDGVSPLPSNFAPLGSKIIGTVGRLDPVKGYDVLLDAFAQLVAHMPEDGESSHALRLVIIGDGSERVALERRVKKLDITSLVWLAGERDDVARLLKVMDVYVCASIAEGMALTILEAMASSLAVVATHVGGNPELVQEQETGTLVPVSDPVALAQALQEMLNQPELLRVQGVAGRDRVQNFFSIDAMVSGYRELYDQLLGTTAAAVKAG